MKVAILGGGYAGMTLAWYLTHYTLGSARIDIYDPAPVAMGATRISMGILNPFMGKQAKPIWQAKRAVREVHRLITESAQVAGAPIVTAKGTLRPATTPDQIADFKAKAIEFSNEVQWWSKKECEEKVPGLQLPPEGGGLYIPESITVNVERYLRGLWVGVARHSVQYLKLAALGKDTLLPYDRVVVALGANTLDFGILSQLPMTRVKGQIIQLSWPKEIPPLPMSLSGLGQIVMAPDGKSCIAGATYERDFTDFRADPEFARQTIMEKITPFFPHLKDVHMIECRARMRAMPKSRLPLLGKLNEKIWFFTGLGSKGLIYSPMCAKQLAQALLLDDENQIMPELRHKIERPQ